jgi:glutamate synthase (NADPH) large chain
MAEDGKEMIASMGDDTPPAVLSKVYVPPAEPLLPPELQPGDQPAHRQPARTPGDEPEDALRQPQERARRKIRSQTEILVLESPFIANEEFRVMVRGVRRRWPSSTAPFRAGGDDALRAGLERIRAEAEDAVRSGAGIWC